jgi:hypothetical protein
LLANSFAVAQFESLGEAQLAASIAMKKTIVGLFALFVALLIFGISHFPDAPIRLQGNLFVGTSGVVHSAAEFAQYRVLERSLLVVGVVTTIAMIAGYIQHRRRQPTQPTRTFA